MKTRLHSNCLKLAMVIPIHKKDQNSNQAIIDQYLFCQTLTNCSKKLYTKELIVFLKNSIVSTSINLDLKRITASTMHSLRLQRKSEKPWIHANLHVVFYVDLQKAFDTINHEILQEKPSIMSFPTLQIHGLIIFRKQKKLVSVNSVDSETQIMRSGVPQGSVLGPSLFFINTNDLHNAISYSQPYHFADDTNLLCISNSPKKVKK